MNVHPIPRPKTMTSTYMNAKLLPTLSLGLLKPVVCVVGPTASGKSLLAQQIALDLDAEVVSADSMQVYRGMDIGTNKVLPRQRKVVHHGFDLVDPSKPFSAALYQRYARECFVDIEGRAKRSVMCGGTGFYVRAAVDAYEFPAGQQKGNAARERFECMAHKLGSVGLWKLLYSEDESSAKLIPPADLKRVIRALELHEQDISYARQREKLSCIPQLVPAVFLGLEVQPALLNERIDQRVHDMIEQGFLLEVEGLLAKGFRKSLTASAAIGYKEMVGVIEGIQTLDQAIFRIKTATHRYAKRQRTWFRKDARIHWLCADSSDTERLRDSALRLLATMHVINS